MTTLHSLLAECERWIGVEPLGEVVSFVPTTAEGHS
jgi:hypothetical protein